MSELARFTTAELVEELNRRNAFPCRCRKWQTFLHYSGGLGCHGCRKRVEECRC